MKKLRNTSFYIILTVGISAVMYWIVLVGSKLEEGKDIIIPDSGKSKWDQFLDSLTYNLEHPLALLLAQIVTIILVARVLGMGFKRIGQPAVIGEIVAGIMLGPSLIGLHFPEFTATLFPAHSISNLQFLSQIGLIFFMFIVGMELDLEVLKHKAREAIVISHVSIIFPFALGLGLAYFLYTSFAPDNVQFVSFGLFMGISMSVTAFPVLARIVQERGLTKTRIGTIVITCAAADDITAWSLLAAIIAIVKAGSFVSSLYTMILAVSYVLLMIKVVRPFLVRIGKVHSTQDRLSKSIVAIFFLILLLSSLATEVIGIHALFGAFMAGAIMPDDVRFKNIFIEKVEDFALILLLPLFFVFTGLRTEIGLLQDPGLWKIALVIIIVAVIGKFVGSAFAALFVGQNLKDSMIIGALMNTRGLMELVILNIGYDLGVLTPQIFSMMVLMALVTTFMTGPTLHLIDWFFKSKVPENCDLQPSNNSYKILISFGNPMMGRKLLCLANNLLKNQSGNSSVNVMHLASDSERNLYNLKKYEKDSFAPVIEVSQALNQRITTQFKVSSDINSDIINAANKGEFNLLLIGIGQSIFEGSILGKFLGLTTKIINPDRLINQVIAKENIFNNTYFDERTRFILSGCNVPVGIYIDKDMDRVVSGFFIPMIIESDIFLFEFVQKLINTMNNQVFIWLPDLTLQNNPVFNKAIADLKSLTNKIIIVRSSDDINVEFISQQKFMLISVQGWKYFIDFKNQLLADIPNTLIIDSKL